MARREMTVEQMMDVLDQDNVWRRFQVGDYPDNAESGNFRIATFKTDREHRRNWILKEGVERDPGSGTFHKLMEVFPGELDKDGKPKDITWMSDTRAEIQEHYEFFGVLQQAQHVEHKRLLINGLGLGMVTHGALTFRGIDRVDVVESNEDVLRMVAPLIPSPKVVFHLGDAYEMEWPKGTRWDYIWHDIWPEISDDNLPGMATLKAKYKDRCHWQGFWQIEGCKSMERAFRMMEDGTLPPEVAYGMLNGIAAWRLGV